MSARRTSRRARRSRGRSIAGLVLCLVLVTKPQLIVAPLTSLSTWFGQRAAHDVQHDLEQRGVVSLTPTTLP